MSKNKKAGILPINGKTTDGNWVVGGVYDFHQSLGLPLEILFFELKSRNLMPDWSDFYKSASLNGMKHSRIIGKLQEEAVGPWGADFVDKVVDVLNEKCD